MASLTNDEILIPPKQRRLLSAEGRELLKRVLSDDTAENLFNPELMLNKTVRMKNFNNTLTGKVNLLITAKNLRGSHQKCKVLFSLHTENKKTHSSKKKEMEKKQLDNEHENTYLRIKKQ